MRLSRPRTPNQPPQQCVKRFNLLWVKSPIAVSIVRA
jgi:hypothetical protein